MTKDEMMAGFDEVVTDPRLRRPVVDARRPLAAAIAPGGPPPEGLRIGIVGAASPVHSSGFAAALAGGPPIELIPAPVTLPLAEIVARLNAASPPALLGYPTMLRRLGDERRAGRLRIAPRSVTAMSELLIPADARRHRRGVRRAASSTCSSPPRGSSGTASPAAGCSASPATCASPSWSTPATGPARPAPRRPRCSSPTCIT